MHLLDYQLTCRTVKTFDLMHGQGRLRKYGPSWHLARPERLLAGFARSSLAHRSGPPARLRARRPTRLADSPGCRTPGRLRRRREFDRLTAGRRSADWSQTCEVPRL